MNAQCTLCKSWSLAAKRISVHCLAFQASLVANIENYLPSEYRSDPRSRHLQRFSQRDIIAGDKYVLTLCIMLSFSLLKVIALLPTFVSATHVNVLSIISLSKTTSGFRFSTCSANCSYVCASYAVALVPFCGLAGRGKSRVFIRSLAVETLDTSLYFCFTPCHRALFSLLLHCV